MGLFLGANAAAGANFQRIFLRPPSGSIPSSGLQLWLKADSGVSTSGSSVTAWLDQSPNAYNFVPDSVTADISLVSSVVNLNNKPAIRFRTVNNNGNIGLYNNTVFTGKSAILVYILESVAGFEYSVIYENSGINLYTSYDNGNRRFGGYFNQFYNATTLSTLNVPYIRSCLTDNGVALNFFLNGNADGTPTGNGFYPRTQTVIGNGGARLAVNPSGLNQPFQGYLAEIVVYDRVLTTPERQQVENYLNSKYNIY